MFSKRKQKTGWIQRGGEKKKNLGSEVRRKSSQNILCGRTLTFSEGGELKQKENEFHS